MQDVVISSDGQFCLTGSWDGTLRLWDLNTGSTTRRFVGHTKDVLSVAFSVDNRQVRWRQRRDEKGRRIQLHSDDWAWSTWGSTSMHAGACGVCTAQCQHAQPASWTAGRRHMNSATARPAYKHALSTHARAKF